MDKSQEAGKYQVDNDETVQGQVIGDHATIHQHFYASEDKAPPSTKKTEQPWNIPYPRNIFFTGRDKLLSQLQKQLQTGQKAALSQPQAISGLGGIGKTQIAVEYAYRYRQDYQTVLWARAESREGLISSFVEIATLLNLPGKDDRDQTLTVQAVKIWLQANSGWLLILDNADELAIAREFLPSPLQGHLGKQKELRIR